MAGGVALNCVANGRILREKIFDDIWIQPAAGDAGGALGAALTAWNLANDNDVPPTPKVNAMRGSLLGPEFSDDEIEATLLRHEAVYERLNKDAILDRTVGLLREEKVIGWFQGRMEFGPRALGNRSILGDARSSKMQSVMNLKVKFRESFRPFAPIVRREKVDEYFELSADSPYMLIVAPIRPELRLPVASGGSGLELLKQVRSKLPAITHVDFSARVQTVTNDVNPLLYQLLQRFEQATDCGVLVNTSFNVRGEPVVCSPEDAYRCFVNTEMDYLVMGNFLLEREKQPAKLVARRVAPQAD
jgi:carbamoyltransferase